MNTRTRTTEHPMKNATQTDTSSDNRHPTLSVSAGVQHATKVRAWRSFISASRLCDTLRYRLGCYETGERGISWTYWMTPNNLRFRVDDPVADTSSTPVIRTDGRRQLFYSYGYATE